MKKITLLLILAAALGAGPLHAQSFQQGSDVLSVGAGLGSAIGSFSYGSQTPALSVQYEHGVWEIGGPGVISLGGYAGIKGYKYSTSSYKEKWNYTIIGLRSAYHYNGLRSEALDLYGGLMLSYNILHYSYKDAGGNGISGAGNYGSAAGFTLFVGGRYYFTPGIGVFAELGYGVSFLTLGLAFSF